MVVFPPYNQIYHLLAVISRGKMSKAWIHRYYGGASFSTVKKGNPGQLVYKYYYPTNPRSPVQQGNRSIFYDAVKNWQSFDVETKRYYNALKGQGIMSGYNRYIRLYLNANKNMIIYWDTLEKNASDDSLIPDYIGSEYFTRGLDIQPITWDGWLNANETWTYASATTFTISGDKTDKYQKGDKIKVYQSGWKYFYIVGVSYSDPNTTITVTGGSDYSLANANLVNPKYSKIESPQDFPFWFNWTPVFTGFSSDPTGVTARFSLSGNRCYFYVDMDGAGTSNATSFRLTLPITAISGLDNSPDWGGGNRFAVDSGSLLSAYTVWLIQEGGTVLHFYKTAALGGWTNSGGKRAGAEGFYEI